MGPAAVDSKGRLQVYRGAEAGALRSARRSRRIAQPLRALGWNGSEIAQSARGVKRQISGTRKKFAWGGILEHHRGTARARGCGLRRRSTRYGCSQTLVVAISERQV